MSALSNTTSVRLDRFDLAAVLAGLRLLQTTPQVSPEINAILTDCGEFVPPSLEEIDALCERINTEGADT